MPRQPAAEDKPPAFHRLSIAASALAGVFFLAFGIWAFADPSSFYDAVAEFPPYNRHFLHDIGAFQIGIGVTLLVACWQRDALVTAAAGAGVGSAFHTIAHFVDRDLGGSAGQTGVVGVVAAVLLAIAALRLARPVA
jgi:hypothetical protein